MSFLFNLLSEMNQRYYHFIMNQHVCSVILQSAQDTSVVPLEITQYREVGITIISILQVRKLMCRGTVYCKDKQLAGERTKPETHRIDKSRKVCFMFPLRILMAEQAYLEINFQLPQYIIIPGLFLCLLINSDSEGH